MTFKLEEKNRTKKFRKVAEDQAKILTATVQKGEGEGTFYIALPWVKRQIQEKVGFIPYPGTLNLRLPRSIKLKDLMSPEAIREIKPEEGFTSGKLFKAVLMDKIEGAVIIPNISNYPENMLEFVAPINLRKKLNLKDDDSVKITLLTKY